MTDVRRKEQLRIQAVGAAISRRDWHAVEQAYNAIRDEFDRRALTHPAPSETEASVGVKVKALEWSADQRGNLQAIAACGWASVEVRSDGRWRWSLGGVAAGTERRKEDAVKMLTNSYETRIRAALEGRSDG